MIKQVSAFTRNVLPLASINAGYWLDEDDHLVYLMRGEKELVATFSAMGATSDQIREAVIKDKQKGGERKELLPQEA